MALKLKVLKTVLPPPSNQDPGAGEGNSNNALEDPILDPQEGTSNGPTAMPTAEARRRDHIYNQSALHGW